MVCRLAMSLVMVAAMALGARAQGNGAANSADVPATAPTTAEDGSRATRSPLELGSALVEA